MSSLSVSVGQHSDKGRKSQNQDFHGIYIPKEPQLGAKGMAMALADGISTSNVSQIASQMAVTGFLEDYFCTSDAWAVKRSGHCVLSAINAWLYSQTRQSQFRFDLDRGYVCTFTALILKAGQAHIFHIGDARIHLLRGESLEQLTEDHRSWVSSETSFLSRALGINPHLEADYRQVALEKGDIFIITTDGIHEYVDKDFLSTAANIDPDLDQAAKRIVAQAFGQGSPDNLTVQLVRIENLPPPDAVQFSQLLGELPLPPLLRPRATLDGYVILRELQVTHRSHIHLATDQQSGTTVVIKTPSTDMRANPAYLDRFALEEWIARRIDSPNVLKPCLPERRRTCLYLVTEYIDGQSLVQWMIDHPRPDLESVRRIIEQIAAGLRAFHRMDMLHQDLRPANVMIDNSGTVKIIDFGSTRVAGLAEMAIHSDTDEILGTAAYSAPEYFLGQEGTPRSDLFSLGVISYQLLSGYLPYGTEVAKSRTKAAQSRLQYRSLLDYRKDLPAWVDGALQKSLQPNPDKRYSELSEFLYDLRHPNKAFAHMPHRPFAERNPVLFWQLVSLALATTVLALLILRSNDFS